MPPHEMKAQATACSEELLSRAKRQLSQVIDPTPQELAQALARLECLAEAGQALNLIRYDVLNSTGKRFGAPLVHVDLGLISKWNVDVLGLSWQAGELSRFHSTDAEAEFACSKKPESAKPRTMAATDFCRMIEELPAMADLLRKPKFPECQVKMITALPVQADRIIQAKPEDRPDKVRLLLSVSHKFGSRWAQEVLFNHGSMLWDDTHAKGRVLSLQQASGGAVNPPALG